MSERPEFRRIAAATDIAEFAHAYAGWSRQIYERVGPLLGALLAHGAGGDPLLENLVATIERERRQGNTNGLTGLARQVALPDGPARERLIDAMWTLTSPEVYNRLVGRGWTGAQYERWLGDQLTAALSST